MSLSAYSDRPGLPCAATVLNSEEAKCLAAPGGLVFITLGCLRVAESESEVAGLLAQALAHSQLRHPLALLEQVRAGARPGAGAKPGEGAKPVTQAEPQEFSAWAEEAAKRLMQQGFALEQVRAASRAATAMLLRLGYEPGGLKVFLARAQVRMLEKSGRLPDVDLGPYKTGGQAVEERLAELHAPVTGRSLTDRYRRECVTCLPAMRR